MRILLKPVLATAAFGLAALLPSARAQLTIAGSTHGDFVDPGLAHTVVTNGPVVSLFSSGIPFRASDTQTSLTFTGQTFAAAGDGDQVNLGTIKIKNGITRLGSTASWAAMDLYLDLPSHSISNFKLTTLLFTIDNTANNGVGNVPDLFYVGHTTPASLKFASGKLNFDVKLTKPAFGTGSGASIAENHSDSFGLYADLHFSPVPEASTYALWGSALLVGLIGLRRFRVAQSAS
jgi:hypothetical protein